MDSIKEDIKFNKFFRLKKLQIDVNKIKNYDMDKNPNSIICDGLYFYIHKNNTEVRNKDGLIMLSKLTSYLEIENVDLFQFKDILFQDKIDISKICNTLDDNSINLFKYTENIFNGKIDLAKFTNSISQKIEINKFFDNDVIDLGILTDSSNYGEIDWSKINVVNLVDNNKLMLSKLTDSSNNNKIDLLKIPYCISKGKIDISKIKNDKNDENIDLFKYTNNTKNGKIDIANFINGIFRKIKPEIFFTNGRIDQKILEDSSIHEIIDMNNSSMKKFIHNGKIMLFDFTKSKNNQKLDLFSIPFCIHEDKIDISKIKNTKKDENIDFFKYTINLTYGKIDMLYIIDSSTDNIDLKRFDGIFDENDRLDLGKVILDTEKNAKNFFSGLPLMDNKILLSEFVDSRRNDEFIDPFDLKYLICNENGRVDFNMLYYNESNEIDVYNIYGLVDEYGRLDLSKITDSGNKSGRVDLFKTNFEFQSLKSGKFKLNMFTDTQHNGKIDLFDLKDVISEEKIDINIICNDDSDDNVNLFKFTRNLKDGQIDFGILTDSDENLIDVHRLCEIIDDNDRMDLSKVTDSSLNGVIDINKLKFDCFGVSNKKLWLCKFTNSKEKDGIDLFKISNVINKGKIDISRLANSQDDPCVDILKYTKHKVEGMVLIDSFRWGDVKRIYLNILDNQIKENCFITSHNDFTYKDDVKIGTYYRYFEYNY